MIKGKTRKILLIALAALITACLALPGLAAAQAQGRVVRIGWYASGENDSPAESTGANGYDYEYLQALSQYTGWTYEYVPGTWGECLQRLESGDIDLLGFVSKTPERETVFAYPNLPMAVTNAWIVISSTGGTYVEGPKTLNGMKVGIVTGNAYNEALDSYCEKYGYQVERVEYPSLTDIAPALERGEIDAAVVSDEDITSQEHCLLRLSSNNQYYVTGIGNTELFSELEEAMMQVNTYCPYLSNDLYSKYFTTNVYGKPVFTADEQKFIDTHPNILVKYDSGWPPVEYFDEESGDYKGISPDLFKLLSEKCGIDFVYEGSTSGQVLSELQNEDDKNILTTISYDYAWAEKHNVYITQPFISSSIVKLGKNTDAENPTVAINENAYFTYLLADELEGVSTKHFAKQAERLEAVRNGECDYTFVTEDQANYYCSMPKYRSLQSEKLMGYDQKICISVTKNSDRELIGIISKCLAAVSHDEMNAIIRSNTVNSYEWTVGDFLYTYRLPVIIIGILLAAVILALALLSNTRRKTAVKLAAAYAQEQEAHEKMKEALVVAEKASAAKGGFLSRVSHEIRTPLNAVIGYNTIARSEMSSTKTEADRRMADMKVMDCLTKSELASKHLLTIINDVLDMSAIESGKIKVAHERFDFKNLITSLTSIFYSQAKAKGVELEVLFDTLTEEWFVGDQMRVNQILTNLLSNAIKFTPAGGTVKLTICQPEADTNAAHIHFEISDTGIGMKREYLEHIWTPFEQEDSSISRRFGGSGLGLSITKNLVDLMNGKISVESELGVGSTFAVDLTFERTEQPKKSKTYDFSGINALVVDDDVSTCDYVSLLFTRCGASCKTVTSGEEAVEAFRAAQSSAPFTVCMIDWRMPRMDGLETVKRIRNVAGEDIPIIIITAYDFSEIADAARDVGVNLLVSKPLFQSSLFDLLANISGNRAPVEVNQNVEYSFAGSRVLLAEDNAMNMEVASRVLASVDLELDCAVNGREAVEKFLAAPAGTYKAILMDIQMPVMDGHEATRTIRASDHPEAKTIPIIAMTADAFAENVSEALAAGMNDHVAKPIDMQQLFETLSKYIDNRL